MILSKWAIIGKMLTLEAACAGKSSVADYLVRHHGFVRLHLSRVSSPSDAVKDEIATAKQFNPQKLSFSSPESLLEYVTKRWDRPWVTTDIRDETDLDLLQRRPFFILISVEAPISLRWRRQVSRYVKPIANGFLVELLRRRKSLNETSPTLEDFALQDDAQLYSHKHNMACLIDRAEIHLVNQTSSRERLYEMLRGVDLANGQRLRPNWDEYFMQLASLAAHRSNCMKRRVGCVLVREQRVISTGYNGTPRHLRNCNEGGCM